MPVCFLNMHLTKTREKHHNLGEVTQLQSKLKSSFPLSKLGFLDYRTLILK